MIKKLTILRNIKVSVFIFYSFDVSRHIRLFLHFRFFSNGYMSLYCFHFSFHIILIGFLRNILKTIKKFRYVLRRVVDIFWPLSKLFLLPLPIFSTSYLYLTKMIFEFLS